MQFMATIFYSKMRNFNTLVLTMKHNGIFRSRYNYFLFQKYFNFKHIKLWISLMKMNTINILTSINIVQI